MTTPLSPELLNELAARWRAQSAPILDHLQPGLSDAEMDAITASVGITLPAEPRLWWGWHNGVSASVYATRMGKVRLIGPSLEYLPLEEAVQQYELMRRLAADAGTMQEEYPADWWWDPMWFPIAKFFSGSLIACDCSDPTAAQTPIHAVEWGTMEDTFRDPRARSFGEMAGWWLEAFDEGVWRHDASADRWEYHWERLSRERDYSRLV